MCKKTQFKYCPSAIDKCMRDYIKMINKMATKRVKILEVFAEVSDEDPNPKYAWKFFGKFDLHKIIGLLEHIKAEQIGKLMSGTFQEKPE